MIWFFILSIPFTSSMPLKLSLCFTLVLDFSFSFQTNDPQLYIVGTSMQLYSNFAQSKLKLFEFTIASISPYYFHSLYNLLSILAPFVPLSFTTHRGYLNDSINSKRAPRITSHKLPTSQNTIALLFPAFPFNSHPNLILLSNFYLHHTCLVLAKNLLYFHLVVLALPTITSSNLLVRSKSTSLLKFIRSLIKSSVLIRLNFLILILPFSVHCLLFDLVASYDSTEGPWIFLLFTRFRKFEVPTNSKHRCL